MLAAGVYSHAGHEGASSIYASEGMTAAPTRDSMRREEEERQGLLLRGGEQRQIARDAYPEIVRGQPARPGDWPERPLCCCCCCTGAGHAEGWRRKQVEEDVCTDLDGPGPGKRALPTGRHPSSGEALNTL